MRKFLALLFSGPLLAISVVAISPANASSSAIEINSVAELSCTSVEILFTSSIPKKSLAYYVITASADPSLSQAKSIKKIIKTKATGLITAEMKNLNPGVAYKFSISAKTNRAKSINSEAMEYVSICNLMDVLSNLPADWGNPKPPPIAAPAFTLSSSSETRTVNTTATGFTINSTGGAIASFAINATPAGMSFNTITGALTGTPTSVATATAYTITATNASGSATRTFTLTVNVAAPAFTLSSSSETRTVNTTATGFTINSTGGAISSFAINATPAGMSFSNSTGALTGTPTSVASATAYTITATNATGSATQTFTLTVSAAAIIYNVGDTGPGGGKIFYKAATPFACGPSLNLSCTYLEGALRNGSIDLGRAWSTSGNQNISVPGAYETAIGTGYKNSLAIAAQTGNVATSSAAMTARAHTGGGMTDWYLPSRDELTQLWQQKAIVGGFEDSNYWSSTELNAGTAYKRKLDGGSDSGSPKGSGLYFRPIRAF